MSTYSNVQLCNVEMLNTRKDQYKFNQGIKIQLISKKYNKEAPPKLRQVVTRGSTIAGDNYVIYYTKLNIQKEG